jgi:hypothetical protein
MAALNFLTPRQLYQASFLLLSVAVVWSALVGHLVEAAVTGATYALSQHLCANTRWAPPQCELLPISLCLVFLLQWALVAHDSGLFPLGLSCQVMACWALSLLVNKAQGQDEAYVLGSLFIANVSITQISIAQAP